MARHPILLGVEPEVREFFDRAYRDHQRYWWRQPERYSIDPEDHRDSLITYNLLKALQRRSPGRALDVGAGEGSDAIRLALLGYEVDAVEGSSVGAQKIEDFARGAKVSVRVFNEAVEDFAPARGEYDVVVCNGLLHYVRDKSAVLSKLQVATAPKGIHAVSTFTDYTPVPECHQIIPVFPDAERGVIAASYEDWSGPHWLTRNRKEQSHTELGAHRHSFLKLIRRRATALD